MIKVYDVMQNGRRVMKIVAIDMIQALRVLERLQIRDFAMREAVLSPEATKEAAV